MLYSFFVVTTSLHTTHIGAHWPDGKLIITKLPFHTIAQQRNAFLATNNLNFRPVLGLYPEKTSAYTSGCIQCRCNQCEWGPHLHIEAILDDVWMFRAW